MPEYELRLRFTAADGSQASRLAEAWADTCAAESPGRTTRRQPLSHRRDVWTVGYRRRATGRRTGCRIRHVDGTWLAVKGAERGYEPDDCDANPHYIREWYLGSIR